MRIHVSEAHDDNIEHDRDFRERHEVHDARARVRACEYQDRARGQQEARVHVDDRVVRFHPRGAAHAHVHVHPVRQLVAPSPDAADTRDAILERQEEAGEERGQLTDGVQRHKTEHTKVPVMAPKSIPETPKCSGKQLSAEQRACIVALK
ncbi:hypothetical protein PsorP6_000863 [Peronosclerospora sorghi]|uniref:Uncharacterized protein n=1 Tax=Peronosclerospora sorghi TaxID=230839 RepID=A0ACC0WR38_9STRA|nr:hypothetical protein PsorP6_000863 [Peronosclerospora sorghi]